MTFPLFAAKKFISPHRRRTNQVPVFEAAGGRSNIRDFHILCSVLIKLNLAALRTIQTVLSLRGRSKHLLDVKKWISTTWEQLQSGDEDLSADSSSYHWKNSFHEFFQHGLPVRCNTWSERLMLESWLVERMLAKDTQAGQTQRNTRGRMNSRTETTAAQKAKWPRGGKLEKDKGSSEGAGQWGKVNVE